MNSYVNSILDAKEKRAKYQQSLQETGQTLVVIKANYPGVNKDNLDVSYSCTKAYLYLKDKLDIVTREAQQSAEGLIYFLLVRNELRETKIKAIECESLPWIGRLLDIDVFKGGQTISRKEVGEEERTCFLCRQPAKYCGRNQTHSLEETQGYFHDSVHQEKFKGRLKEILENVTWYGLLGELTKEYGLGCVNVNDPGIHGDMNFMMFIDSAEVIAKSMKRLVEIDTTQFNELRELGKEIEAAMFQVTGGINTYKGVIFILLLVYAGFLNTNQFIEISSEVKRLCASLGEDFKNPDLLSSHGGQLFVKQKIKGIRGSAMQGFSNYFIEYLPFYMKEKSAIKTFVFIGSQEEDTTVIHRLGVAKLEEMQRKFSQALEKETFQELDSWCLEEGVSCGGCADILATTIILNEIQTRHRGLKLLQMV